MKKSATREQNRRLIEKLRQLGLVQDEAVTVYRGGGPGNLSTFTAVRDTLKQLKARGEVTPQRRRLALLQDAVGGLARNSPVRHVSFNAAEARNFARAPLHSETLTEYKIPVGDLERRFAAVPADEVKMPRAHVREAELSLLGDISRFKTRQLPLTSGGFVAPLPRMPIKALAHFGDLNA